MPADVGVVTHPAFRGRGLARRLVSYMVADQLPSVGVVRYRALQTNLAALVIATSLGFVGEAKTSLYDSRRRELPSTRSTAGFLRKLDVVLDPGEMSTFEDRGFVKLEAVVNRDRLAGLAAAAWMALGAQFGISDDRTTWPLGARKTVRRAVRDDPAFVELGTSTITVLVDRVLGAGSWAPPRHWGATMEVVFPALDAGPWRLPTTPWHLDFPFDMQVDRVGGLKVVVLLDEVAPDGGATLVVARSHHAIARFVRTAADCSDHSGTQKAFLKSAPWLRQLHWRQRRPFSHGDVHGRRGRHRRHSCVGDGSLRFPGRHLPHAPVAGSLPITQHQPAPPSGIRAELLPAGSLYSRSVNFE